MELSVVIVGYICQTLKSIGEFKVKKNPTNKYKYSKQYSKAFVLSMILTKKYKELLPKLTTFIFKTRNYFDRLIYKLSKYNNSSKTKRNILLFDNHKPNQE